MHCKEDNFLLSLAKLFITLGGKSKTVTQPQKPKNPTMKARLRRRTQGVGLNPTAGKFSFGYISLKYIACFIPCSVNDN